MNMPNLFWCIILGLLMFCLVACCIGALFVIFDSVRFNKRTKRPKCPNVPKHNCGDCIHAEQHWDGLKFRGFSCRINAR